MRSSILPVPTARRIHRQGSLDGLCGVYSIVNSLKLTLGDAVDEKRLFSSLVLSLGPKAPKVVVNGMHLWQYVELMRKATSLMHTDGITIHFRRAFPVWPTTLREYWTTIADHHTSYGRGSVVLGMEGIHSHWTCVEQVADDGLHLADSGDVSFLPKDQCTISRCNRSRPHKLIPTQTFLLICNEQPCDRPH